MWDLSDAAEGWKESKSPDVPLVEMAYKLVPGLESLSEIACSQSQLNRSNTNQNKKPCTNNHMQGFLIPNNAITGLNSDNYTNTIMRIQ